MRKEAALSQAAVEVIMEQTTQNFHQVVQQMSNWLETGVVTAKI